jgi:cation diffusion facilitator CzcD-associated flavoprotein CzcO
VVAYPGGELGTITEKGFLNPDGQEEEVDVIILATGFNTTWVPRFPIVANGKNLQDMYARNPLSYLGIAAPEIPNYFTYYGPYGPLGQASAVVMIEFFTRYFNTVIRKMQTEWIKSITPRMDVALDFQEHADLYLKRTVWDAHCRSWWKGGKYDGRIMLYPGSRTQ